MKTTIRRMALLAAGAFALSACGGNDNDTSSAASNAPAATDAPAATPAAEDNGEAQSGGTPAGGGIAAPPADFGRKLVINATMTVETKDVAAAAQQLNQLALANGGAVFNSEIALANEARGTVTLRVPPSQMGALRDGIAGLGKVVAQGQSTADVTDEYVDTEARITAAQASVDRVLGFYEKATDVKELTALESELTRRQAELEVLLGKRRVLADKVSLATMIVELFEPAKAPEPNAATAVDEDPTIKSAFTGGANGLWQVVKLIGIVLAALLPFLAVAAVIGYPIWRVMRRRARTPKPLKPPKAQAARAAYPPPPHRVVGPQPAPNPPQARAAPLPPPPQAVAHRTAPHRTAPHRRVYRACPTGCPFGSCPSFDGHAS
jgi:Domain of unknown function (DUF4349)